MRFFFFDPLSSYYYISRVSFPPVKQNYCHFLLLGAQSVFDAWSVLSPIDWHPSRKAIPCAFLPQSELFFSTSFIFFSESLEKLFRDQRELYPLLASRRFCRVCFPLPTSPFLRENRPLLPGKKGFLEFQSRHVVVPDRRPLRSSSLPRSTPPSLPYEGPSSVPLFSLG